MASIIGRVKAVKDLFLEKLDALLAHLPILLEHSSTSLENDASLLEANLYIVRALQEQGQALRIQHAELIERLDRNASAVSDGGQDHQPHIALLVYLYSWLPERTALCTSCEDTRAIAPLLSAGYEVFLPPGPWTAELPTLPRLHPLSLAGQGPTQVALTLTAAGHDPTILPTSPVVCHSFIATELPAQVEAMRSHGYHWFLVLYRTTTSDQVACYANQVRSLPESWGHAIYFMEYALFAEALRWSISVLPHTFFR